jgi:four helix bundle protein
MQKLNAKLRNDIKARAFVFSLNIIELCDTLPNKNSVWVISKQLLRSSMSVGANIAEAKSASSRLEFKRYYEIALKSSNESLYWLSLLKMSKLAAADTIKPFITEVTEISKMLAKSVMTLKEKNKQ